MAKVPYGVETLPKISIVWVGRTNVTDDRQTTDGPTMTYSEHELEFTFAKKSQTCNTAIQVHWSTYTSELSPSKSAKNINIKNTTKHEIIG